MTKHSELVMPKKPENTSQYFTSRMHNINAVVGLELKKRAKKFSEESKYSMSEIVRFALERLLDANGY